VVALVTLAEGPRMMTRIIGAIESAKIGQKVRVRFERQGGATVLPFFEALE
jgi:uncharacterized OB-fold protein